MTEPAICIVGCASWDTMLPIDHYPNEGEYCIASDEIEQPGGTSTNTAVALARLGLPPRFVGMVGDDWRGERLRAGLEAAGVMTDTLQSRHGQRSDRSIITVSPTGGRTIFWLKGAMLQRDDPVDTDLVFAHRLVYLDLVDLDLWEMILDAHAARGPIAGGAPSLIGQAVYVAGVLPPDRAGTFIRRHHFFIGASWEWRLMIGTEDDARMSEEIRGLVADGPLRAALVTRGASGCTLITADGTVDLPAFRVPVLDSTGAGDAFAAGVVYGVAQGWLPPRCARFANAVGALATRGLGAQTSLPTRDEAMALAFGPRE